MKNKLLLIMLLGLFLIGNVFALDNLGTFKVGDSVRISQVCNDATYITLSSITFPNSSTAIEQINMTSLGSGEFYYNFLNTSTVGRYDVRGISDGCENTFATYFEITPSGFVGSNVISFAIWFLFIISIILFLAFLFVNAKPPVKWTFFLISMMFLLQTVSILFTSLQDAVVNPKIVGYFDFLASASFILFWFAMGLLAVLWILTTLQTLLLKNKQTKEAKYQ